MISFSGIDENIENIGLKPEYRSPEYALSMVFF
jgi:hypothetical protein